MILEKYFLTQDEEMIRLAFRALDKDGSGTVSTKEFKHLMTHLGRYFNHCISVRSYK